MVLKLARRELLLGLISIGGAALTGCSLSAPSTAHLQISMPPGGFGTPTPGAERTMDLSRLFFMPGAHQRAAPKGPPPPTPPSPTPAGTTTSSGGGGDFPVPQQLSDFVCAAILVTAADIPADPVFTQACDPQDANGNPINVGVFGGFVPSAGGTIDIQVQNGSARNFQLIGVQYNGTACPSAADILSQANTQGNNGNNLGNPYVISSVTQDVGGDETVVMNPSFTPGAQPLFSCANSNHGSSSGTGPVAGPSCNTPVTFSDVQLYPLNPTNGSQIRVTGAITGCSTTSYMVNLYSDAACTSQISADNFEAYNQGGGSGGTFIASALGVSPSLTTVYAQAVDVNQTALTPCTLAQGSYQYNPSAQSIFIGQPMPGTPFDAGTTTLPVSGICSTESTPINVFLNGVAASWAGSCFCGGGNFSCTVSASSLATLGNGIALLSVQTTQGAFTGDDELPISYDPQAPGVTVSGNPVLVTPQNQGAYVVGGTCGSESGLGANTQPVYIYYDSPGQPEQQLGITSNCASGSWQFSLNLSSLPAGPFNLDFSHGGTPGSSDTSWTGQQYVKVASQGVLGSGENHVCVANSAGVTQCWGDNTFGQGGSAGPTMLLTPSTVSGLSGALAIAGGQGHTCAVLQNGGVSCWGNNGSGQLGNGTTTNSTSPVQVVDVPTTGTLSGIIAIAASASATCGLSGAGNVYCWGSGSNGELGAGAFGASTSPVQVVGVGGTGFLSSVTAIAGGADGFHFCALTNSQVVCWGQDIYGQLGNAGSGTSNFPVQVQDVGGGGFLSGITAIAAGASHSCAISSTTAVYCWGQGINYQLGNNAPTNSSVPTQVVGVNNVGGPLSGAFSLALGDKHSCATIGTGGVVCWGDGTYGQLGNGTSGTPYSTPQPVNGPGGGGTLVNIYAVSAGASSTCAISLSGAIFCWGTSSTGQLGSGTTTSVNPNPIEVMGY